MNVQQGDHDILFQMPEVLLFDMFVPQSGDGGGVWGGGDTREVYPSRIRWVIVLLSLTLVAWKVLHIAL